MPPFTPPTVIVRVWLLFTAFVAVGGVIEMFASTQALLASLPPPAVVFSAVLVARVTDWPLTDNVLVACTTVVPVAADVITTVQCGTAAVFVMIRRPPRKEPGPLAIEAVAVKVPASIVPFTGATVIVSVWLLFTALVAVNGEIEIFPSTHVLLT